MQKRLMLFTVLVAATGAGFFLWWQTLQLSVIPPAAAAAAQDGTRLDSHRVHAVDLSSIRSVWLAWGLAAVLGYWRLEKEGRGSRRGTIALFALYLVPLVTTSAMLLVS